MVQLCIGFCFGRVKLTLVGYSDPYMAGDIGSKKSTSSFMIKFLGGVLAWKFRL